MSEDYERDEFDEIAERGGPVGVHRAPRPWWHLVLTPLIVFVIAGLVAFLVATFLWNSGDGGSDDDATASPSATASVSASPSAEASESASAEPSETSSPEPSETEEPEPVVDYGASVAVLNGTGVTGLAGAQAAVLEDAGFTDVSAANLTGDRPDVNTVVYTDDAMADTAAEVAAQLGFDAVVQGTPETGAAVEVQIVAE